MDSGRTKFITDTRRQIQTSQQRIDTNIEKYYKNLAKLKAYKVQLVSEQLTKMGKEEVKQINQGILDMLMSHLLKLEGNNLTLEECQKDIGDYAKTISSIF